MAVQCKNGDVTFDTSATTATNADSIEVGTAVPGELPGELPPYCAWQDMRVTRASF